MRYTLLRIDLDWTTLVDSPSSYYLLDRLRSILLSTSLRRSRVCECRTRPSPSDYVAGLYRSDGGARYLGLIQCESLHCPVCGRYRAAVEAHVAGVLLRSALDAGHFVYLVTLTVAHTAADDLASVVHRLLAAWRQFQQGHLRDAWSGLGRDRVGAIRRLEITYSSANGFHPHLHVALVLRRDVPPSDLAALLDARWARCLALAGLSGLPGIRLHVVRAEARGLSRYLSKWSLPDELSSFSAKRSLTIFDLIGASDARPECVPLVVAYYLALRSRRTIDGVSRLARALGLSIHDLRAEAEAAVRAALDASGPLRLVVPLTYRLLRRLCDGRLRGYLLSLALSDVPDDVVAASANSPPSEII